MTTDKLQVAQAMYRSGQYTVATIARTLGSAGPRSTAISLITEAESSPRGAGPMSSCVGIDTGVADQGSYLSVWSSISAVGALRLTDSMPLIALALLS
jgi:hypothetical protein